MVSESGGKKPSMDADYHDDEIQEFLQLLYNNILGDLLKE